tara:strand:- start:45 stop:302 length:258 start_codon:yes stop_codon:yes gene_type:complete
MLKNRDMKNVLKLSAVFLAGALPVMTVLNGGLCLIIYMFKDIPPGHISYGALVGIVCSSFVLAILLFLSIGIGMELAEKLNDKLN